MGTPNREPQEYSRNIGIYCTYQGPHIPLCSYNVLGVPCLGFPLKSLSKVLPVWDAFKRLPTVLLPWFIRRALNCNVWFLPLHVGLGRGGGRTDRERDCRSRREAHSNSSFNFSIIPI